jgi:5-methylcytosine-specific restriction enzyme subunit McrC
MPAYTVREWEKLAYGEAKGQITVHHADRLAGLAARSAFAGRGGSGVLEHGRKALRARGVVGILAAGDASLEILPKIDVAPGETPDHENAAIRKRLVHMLAVALDLKIDLGVITDLAWQRETLLEILIRIFCDKLTETLRKGMPRRYVGREEDLPTLRGQLDVNRQFTVHATILETASIDVANSEKILDRIRQLLIGDEEMVEAAG